MIHRSPLSGTMKLVSLIKLKLCLWLVVLGVGIFQAWVHRYAITADGVSYLDIAHTYFRGDLHLAINGYWSPLYSWLVGLALFLIRPGMQWEYPVAHLVGLIIYLCAYLSFNYFLSNLIRYRRSVAAEENVPEWMFHVMGCLIFLWSTSVLIPWRILTPDILVAAIVYLIGGFLFRFRLGDTSIKSFAILGVLLGLGYLAKAVMFFGAFLFLTVSLLLIRERRLIPSRAMAAICCFVLFAAPFIVALSESKGRLTYGETGKLNYAWYVGGVTWAHWRGKREGWGTPVHTSRTILDSPAVYEFGKPFNVTYPLWYDPSYWYEGVAVRFNLGTQAYVFMRNCEAYARKFTYYGLLFAAGGASLFVVHKQPKQLIKKVINCWWMLIPSVSMIGIFFLVHVEGRLIAPFIVTILLTAVSFITFPISAGGKRHILAGITMAFVFSIGIDTWRVLSAVDTKYRRCLDVAEEVRRLGVMPGEKISSLSYSDPDNFNAKWAHLAGLGIVAEIIFNQDVEHDWYASDETRARVMEAFRKTSATLVAAGSFPPGIAASAISSAGWRQVGQTGVYVYFLDERLEHDPAFDGSSLRHERRVPSPDTAH